MKTASRQAVRTATHTILTVMQHKPRRSQRADLSTSRLRLKSSAGVASTAAGRPQAQPRTTSSASCRQASGEAAAAEASAGALKQTNQ